MKVKEVFRTFADVTISGDPDVEVRGISVDSRKTKPGDLFVALLGTKANGKAFADEAVRRGAVAVASETKSGRNGVPAIFLPEARKRVGEIASWIHGEPSRRLRVVGITGTNGKTTTAHLLEAILKEAGRNPACLGTVGYRWNGVTREAPHTTPEAPDLHAMLKTMLEESVTDVVMECSSHGLELGRLGGLALDVALFTNLTQDHLDFHSTLEAYRAAKWKIFSELLARSPKEKRFAVLNVDDPTGRDWSRKVSFPTVTFSARPSKEVAVYLEQKSMGASGIEARISARGKEISIRSPLVGEFNLSNILAAVAVADALGISPKQMAEAIEKFETVPGRLERVPNEKGIQVFVDYAHTEDALQNVLRALKSLQKRRLIVVFGCGGDRDRGKRPKMAAAACRGGDVVIVTSDNPRTEDPKQILHEIVQGIPDHFERVEPKELSGEIRGVACSMVDRRAAIEQALSISRPGDVVLIAGKGHETYQEIQGVRHPFDDRNVASEWFGGKR